MPIKVTVWEYISEIVWIVWIFKYILTLQKIKTNTISYYQSYMNHCFPATSSDFPVLSFDFVDFFGLFGLFGCWLFGACCWSWHRRLHLWWRVLRRFLCNFLNWHGETVKVPVFTCEKGKENAKHVKTNMTSNISIWSLMYPWLPSSWGLSLELSGTGLGFGTRIYEDHRK